MMRWCFSLVVLGLAWLAPAQPADALVCISLNSCACTVTAADITFDDINPLHDSNESASGQISIQCSGLLSIGTGVIVRLDDGEWGSYSARRMRSQHGDLLDYNIYKPDLPNVVWGDNTAGTQQLVVSGGLLNLGAWNASRTMTARLTVSTATKPGDYSDTVVVTVIY